MPSIPQSLLWISLVVLWLFVLVPMLISKRDAVRRTSDVALATRVLNGGAGSRLLRRKGPAAGHRSDPDWKPEESDLDDVDHDEHSEEDEDRDADQDTDARPTHPVVMKFAVPEQTEPDYLDVDVIEDSGALPAGVSAAETEPVLAADEPETVRAHEAEPASASTTTSTSTSRTRPAWSPTRTTTLSRTGPRPSHRPPHGGAGSTQRPPLRSAPANTRSASVC